MLEEAAAAWKPIFTKASSLSDADKAELRRAARLSQPPALHFPDWSAADFKQALKRMKTRTENYEARRNSPFLL